MRRSVLVSMMVMGAVVTLLMGAGTFAVFTNRATTGQNSAESKALPRAADIQLAFGVVGPTACAEATYVEDNASPTVSMADVEPGSRLAKYFCVKNVGSAALDLTTTVIDVSDVDTACTGDEEAVDTSCGSNGLGELGKVLQFYPSWFPCDLSSGGANGYGGFLSTPEAVSLGNLAAGEIRCGQVEVFYALNIPINDQLTAQSDTVTWRFAFDGSSAS